MNDYSYIFQENQLGTDYENMEEVQNYDLKMNKIRNIQKEVSEINQFLQLKPEHTILEIGCGTADAAIALSHICKKVVATDISEVMLAYAKEKAAKQKRDNIDFVKAGFLTYQPEEIRFDGIVTQLALHHLPDFWKFYALSRIAQWLKPQGKLFLRDVVFPSHISDYDKYFEEIIRQLDNTAGENASRSLALHIQKEYSTLDFVMESILEKSGFVIENQTVENTFFISYHCTLK